MTGPHGGTWFDTGRELGLTPTEGGAVAGRLGEQDAALRELGFTPTEAEPWEDA